MSISSNLKLAGSIATVISATVALAPNPAKAAFASLDYEGIGNNCSVNTFYDGGTDSCSNAGFNYGVTFSSNALGIVDVDAGGSGNFANEPSPNTAMYFLSGQPFMEYLPGFTQFSTYYTSSTSGAVLTFYDGAGGTGNIVGTLGLPGPNFTNNNCTGDPSGTFCNWDLASIILGSTAKSVVFGGVQNQIGFDNTEFNPQENPKNQVPGPLPIFGAAAAFGWSRKLRQRISTAPDLNA